MSQPDQPDTVPAADAYRCSVCGEPASRKRLAYQLPVCARRACTDVLDALGLGPRDTQGMIRTNLSVTTGGGAEAWPFRPPHLATGDHHDQPIVLGGKVHFQQRPPVHVPGSQYREPPAGPRGLSEQEAAERYLAERCTEMSPLQRDVVVLKSRGLSYADIAAELGVSLNVVRERLKRARAHLRRAVAA